MSLTDLLDTPLRQILPILQSRFTDERTKYFGVPTQRVAFDHWVYQEIIQETKPDVIVEIGVYKGGQSLAFAHLCDAHNHGRVIAVEIQPERIHQIVLDHPRVTLVAGNACLVFDQVAALCKPTDRVMVVEDSSHDYGNTLTVCRLYSTLCKPGDYFIVEDTICWRGLDLGPMPGPHEAAEAFLAENPAFEKDESREDFVITWNQGGFLRRKA